MEFKSKSFPTRNGSCHIFIDRLEFSSNHSTASLLRWAYKKGFHRSSSLYILIAVIFLLAALISLYIQNVFLALFFGVAMLFGLNMAWSRRKYSFTPIIKKEQVEQVRYLEAIPGERRAGFEIIFRMNDKAFLKKIFLPGRHQEGEMIAQSAFYMMRDAGYLNRQ